jgi:cell division protein ZapA (FtsZ GTPase activity inhibitor)
LEQLVTIELFGQPYTFKAQSDVSNAKEVADHLVKEVTKIETQYSGKSSVNKLATLILAALNIANENIKLKKNHSDFLIDVSNKSVNLIHTLDAAVNG